MMKAPDYHLLILSALAATALMPPAARAQQVGTQSVPLCYDRVRRMDQVAAGGHLLIGAIVPATAQFRLMQTADVSGRYRKSIGLSTFDTALGGDVDASKVADRVWRLTPVADGRYVLQATDGRYLRGARGSESATALMLSTTDSTLWTLQADADGTFALSHTDGGQPRYVTLYEHGAQTHYYGCYASATATDSRRLMLYLGRTEVHPGATLPAPADSARLAIAVQANGQTTLAQMGGEMMDGEALLLTDGSVAPDSPLGVWTCRRQTDSTFVLCDTTGACLNDRFAVQQAPFVWTLRQAGLTTASGDLRLMVQDNGRFAAVLPHEAVGHSVATLLPVGETPSLSLEGDTRTLSGAWSANALATLPWTATTTLDLTHIALPRVPADFRERPADRTTYILVSAAEAAAVPAAWSMTLACNADRPEDDAVLLTPSVLADRQTFTPPRAFRYAAGQLVYCRQVHADGGWETLCLPFDAHVPADFVVETYEGRDGISLAFHQASAICAHQAYLLCYTGAAGAASTDFVVQASEDGRIGADAPASDTPFFGTYSGLKVLSADEGLYLLNADGSAFVRAAAGSSLPSFRAALRQPGQKASRLQLSHGGLQPDAVPTVAGEVQSDDSPLYDLTGRRVRHPSGGLYLVHGRKVVVTPHGRAVPR